MAPSSRKPPKPREIRKTREQVEREYAWVLALAEDDDTGSLRNFFDWITRKFLENQRRDVPLALPFTQKEFDDEFNKTEWRQRYTGFEAEARRQQADPRLRADWQESIRANEESVRALAEQYGIQLSEDEITQFATDARLQNWDRSRLTRALEPLLERTLMQGGARGLGVAGDAEFRLLNWARQNGLNLSPQAAAQYVSRITLGRQSFEAVQDDIRRTYLAGMFPAWADRINDGFDPSVLFQPYQDAARRLLEVDEISLDDPLMRRATQSMGDDGKPIQVPLYQFEESIRKDPRWQYTDNAYSTYTDVGTDLLRMFGFR